MGDLFIGLVVAGAIYNQRKYINIYGYCLSFFSASEPLSPCARIRQYKMHAMFLDALIVSSHNCSGIQSEFFIYNMYSFVIQRALCHYFRTILELSETHNGIVFLLCYVNSGTRKIEIWHTQHSRMVGCHQQQLTTDSVWQCNRATEEPKSASSFGFSMSSADESL